MRRGGRPSPRACCRGARQPPCRGIRRALPRPGRASSLRHLPDMQSQPTKKRKHSKSAGKTTTASKSAEMSNKQLGTWDSSRLSQLKHLITAELNVMGQRF